MTPDRYHDEKTIAKITLFHRLEMNIAERGLKQAENRPKIAMKKDENKVLTLPLTCYIILSLSAINRRETKSERTKGEKPESKVD